MRRLAFFALVGACSTPSLEYADDEDAGGPADAGRADDAADTATPEEARAPTDDASPANAPDSGADTGAPEPDAGLDDAGVPLGPFCPPTPHWATKCEGPVPCVAKSNKECDDAHDDCQKCTQLLHQVCCIAQGSLSCVAGPLACHP